MKNILYYSVKTLSIALTAFLVFVCLSFGYLYFCNIVGMDVPTLGSFKMYVVLSESMEPELSVDDAVIINSSVSPEDFEVGDIITFHAFESDIIITHRIIAVEQTEQGLFAFRTKGDNNPSEDLFLTPEDRVIGRYSMKISGLARFLDFTVERPYFIALIVVGIILIQFLLGLCEKSLKPTDDNEFQDDKEVQVQANEEITETASSQEPSNEVNGR